MEKYTFIQTFIIFINVKWFVYVDIQLVLYNRGQEQYIYL